MEGCKVFLALYSHSKNSQIQFYFNKNKALFSWGDKLMAQYLDAKSDAAQQFKQPFIAPQYTFNTSISSLTPY